MHLNFLVCFMHIYHLHTYNIHTSNWTIKILHTQTDINTLLHAQAFLKMWLCGIQSWWPRRFFFQTLKNCVFCVCMCFYLLYLCCCSHLWDVSEVSLLRCLHKAELWLNSVSCYHRVTEFKEKVRVFRFLSAHPLSPTLTWKPFNHWRPFLIHAAIHLY